MSVVDPRRLRDALGRFATGVTVVTTIAADGSPVGLTVSSFNSVSLDPPLVLWSLARDSNALEVFEAATHFAVSVLGAEQVDLSTRFATRDGAKFVGLDCPSGAGGAPLIPGAVATFECRTLHRYDGGDHLIFVGRVESLTHRDGPALLFHDGAYAVATPLDLGGD